MSDTKVKEVEVPSESSDSGKDKDADTDKQPVASFISETCATGTEEGQGEGKSTNAIQDMGPIIDPKEQLLERMCMTKKKTRRTVPVLKVLTSRNKNFSPCQSQLSTPATDFTPFHSPADPLKLNSEGPNWHLFNKKVADSLDKLAQLTIQDENSCSLGKECSKKLEPSADNNST